MKYIKPLDAIRAIAVILVIIYHWLPYKYVVMFGLGGIGVDIFFVLSGFLITRILLENKKEAEAHNLGKLKIIKNFIARRTLRIFPIYYLTIIIIYIFSKHTGTSVNKDIAMYLTYSSNVLYFVKQSWDGMLSHLWSLAVEEQFYLIWPWLIVFVNQKHLLKTIVFFMFLGIFSNYALSYLFPNHTLVNILTPTCFDSFCLGGLFSYFMVFKSDKISVFNKYLAFIAPVSFVLFVFSLMFNVDVWIPIRTLISICALYLIVFSIREEGSLVHKFILNNPLLIFIGKISYGVYLFHNMVPWVWRNLIGELDKHQVQVFLINTHVNAAIAFTEKFCVLILISWLSWKIIENPINNLKHRFVFKSIDKPILPTNIEESEEDITPPFTSRALA